MDKTDMFDMFMGNVKLMRQLLDKEEKNLKSN